MQKIILRLTYSVLVRNFLKVIVGVKFHRPKFLVNEEQFIIIANHNSHLDTMTIMASLPSKIVHKVKPVAAVDHFGKTQWQAKLSNYLINTLLIKRKRDKDHPEEDPINSMVKALDEGYSLIIFPEGTRGQPEVQQPLKPGIAMVLLKKPHIKYVPAYMKGMGKAMSKDDNLIVPFTSSIVYGEPKHISGNNVIEILNQMQADLDELKGTI